MSYKQRQGLTFSKPDEPEFLKRIKQKMGYKEPATIEDKVGAGFGFGRKKCHLGMTFSNSELV